MKKNMADYCDEDYEENEEECEVELKTKYYQWIYRFTKIILEFSKDMKTKNPN